MRLTGQVALSLLASLSLAFAIIVGGQLFFGPSSRVGFISVVLGSIAAVVLYYRLYAVLLRRGLRKYLSEQG